MTYTQQNSVKNIRAILHDNPWHDISAEVMDTTEVGLDVTDGTKWSAGDIVEFQDDGEQCLVQSISSNTLTIIRNYLFSVGATAGTGTTHVTSGDIVKNPTFTYSEIKQAISFVIDDLWPYVYKKTTFSLTPQTTGNNWYELDEGSNVCTALELSSVWQEIGTTGAATSYYFQYGARGKSYPIQMHLNVPTAKAGSGVAVYIPYLRDTTNAILVNAISPITDTLSGTTYQDFSAGVEANAIHGLAIARLIATTDVDRTTQQDVNMSNQSSPPGSRTRVASYWEAEGKASRRKWEMKLRTTLPRLSENGRMTTGRQNVYGVR